MHRLTDPFLLTFERIWQHRVLIFWALAGLAAATTLALSLALYLDAVNTGLLASSLSDPPYAFRFRYLGSWNGNITWGDESSATAAIRDGFTSNIGLPVSREVHYTRGGSWALKDGSHALGSFNIGTLQGADDMLNVVAGQWPPPPSSDSSDTSIPALLPQGMMESMGVQVGDKINATLPGAKPVTLRVAALWQPVNANDTQWIYTPHFFDQVVLVQPGDLQTALQGVAKPVQESGWFLVFDGSSLRTFDVNSLLGRITDGQRYVTSVLPAIRLDESPVDGLNAFNQQINQLTQQLVLVILPVAGLVEYFVTLVAGLLASRQLAEDTLLRSRGMSRWRVLGIHVRLWLVLAGLSLAIGIAISPIVVQLIGQTTSFLRFDAHRALLIVRLTPQALAAGGLTAVLAASSGLFLAWRATGQKIRRSGRAGKAWWQRAYLDFALLIPAVYVLYTLWKRGGLVAGPDDPFSDPLTFLGPTLLSFSLTLVFLRLWPMLMRLGAGIMSYTRSVALLMSLRELTRSIGRYRGTLLMMCFTLSLTGFTASMASTLDRSLQDTVDYRIGAQAVLVMAADTRTAQGGVDASTGEQTVNVTGYNTLPAADLLRIDGVADVSRVGRYDARIILQNQRPTGTILGIDRADLAAVTLFRSDYASQPLADLLNLLAGQRTGVLVSAVSEAQYNLKVGQQLHIQVSALSAWYDMNVPIVGALNYFPTLDPSQGFFMIGNIDPIWEAVGTELPHDLWVSLKPGADVNAIQQAVGQLGYPVLQWRDPTVELQLAMSAPSRRGVLGFLSVGFVAAIILTLVGAIVQNTASFRAQATQIGTLRAMGLGGMSTSAYLILLQSIAASSGILSGTAIGVATTLLFLPLLDFSGGLPPYLVRVDWGGIILVYVVFAAILFVVSLATTAVLSRESLAAIVKLGDA